jgi:tetratricopeptide (TPR) repeat protein
MPSEKFTPYDPPIPVDGQDMGKSRAKGLPAVEGQSRGADIAFGTFELKYGLLREKPTPGGSVLWSMGHPDEVAPSQAVWGRGKWELTIRFTLHNLAVQTISVHDIRAHVYYVTGIEVPLGMMIHRSRIELAQDNSLFSTGRGFILRPGDPELIDLVMETSLYDTLMTTIVMGLFVDYQVVEQEKVVLHRLPSDKIYLFQHWRSAPEECHFVMRDSESIRARAQEEPDNRALQDLCQSLDEIYALHCSHDHHKPLPQVITDDSPADTSDRKPADDGEDVSSARGRRDPAYGWQEVPGSIRERATDDPTVIATLQDACDDLSIICSFFDPESIPAVLVYEAFYQRSLAMYDSLIKRRGLFRGDDLYWRIHKLKDGTRYRDEVISRLVKEGFLERSADRTAYRALESRVGDLINRTEPTIRKQWLEYAIRAIDALLPEYSPATSWSRYDALQPHVLACTRYAEEFQIDRRLVCNILHYFTENMYVRSRYAEAEVFGRKCLEVAETTYGPESHVVGLAIGDLAETLRELGRQEEIEGLLQRARSILVRAVGRDHEDYGVCIHNLAVLYRDQQRYEEAEALFQEALQILERAFENGLTLAEALEDQAALLRATNRGPEADVLTTRGAMIRVAAVSADSSLGE